MNKQGTLNEFFGVNSAGGVIAPRNRKAYASKRLQQVVNDFREQQQKESKSKNNNISSTTQDKSSLEGDDAEASSRPVANGGKGRRGSAVGAAAGRGGGRGGRGRARAARAGPSRKRKHCASGVSLVAVLY